VSAERAFVAGAVVGPTTLTIEYGVIVAIDPAGPADDVMPGLLCPGLIDLQVNGVDDIDFWQADACDLARADALLAQHGVTSYLATLVSAPMDRYTAARQRLAHGVRANSGLVGVHLEGPFLGGRPGAHRPDAIAQLADYPDWFESWGDELRLVTVGPEQPGVVATTAALVRRNVTVALGHSAADSAQLDAAIAAGARLYTHLFNATGLLHHRHSTTASAVLRDDRISCSLIADLHHVHPDWLDIAGRAKPADQLIAVSDAVAWRAASAGPVAIAMVDGAPRLPDGTLAGSALWLDQAIANLVNQARWPLERALLACTANPARMIGAHDRGQIAIGRRADLALLNEGLCCSATWQAGAAIVTPS
jgi:N-acetylglucosamine-6-phosphate deacetylase